MRVVVTGATGNVGTSLVPALAAEERVTEIVGVARRRPDWQPPKTRWETADIAHDDLGPAFAGADAVVHLAWMIQPSRDAQRLRDTNVEGTRRVIEAAVRAGVGTLVHASSIGAYSPGPKDSRVREDWPVDGIESSFYSRHKAAAERLLDELERDRPEMRVVRLRPGLIFKREAATGIRRLFAGPFLPSRLLRAELIAVVPEHPRLRVQAVHTTDIAEAYRLAVVDERARGPYNVVSEPVLDAARLRELLGAASVPVPAALMRRAAELAHKLRLQPTPAGWLDLGLGVPLLDATRIREELGWEPRVDAGSALLELLNGMRESAGFDTPPLHPGTSGPLRVRELLTGVGARP